MRPGGLVVRASVGFFRTHPLQLLLGLLGLALGVAVIVAIHTTRESARAAYDLTADILAGRATHQIVGQGRLGVPADLFVTLRRDLGIAAAAPILEGSVSLVGDRGERLRLRLIGVEPFSEAHLRPAFPALPGESAKARADAGGGPGMADIAGLLGTDLGVWMNDATARRVAQLTQRPPAAGTLLPIVVQGKRFTLSVVSVVADAPWLPDQILLTDISTAAAVFAAPDSLTRIDLRLPEGEAGALMRSRIEAALPPAVRLEPADGGGLDVGEMTGAFYTNLTALGLLALLVGMFLVFSTQSFLVTQRRELFGTLRALGVTRGELAWLLLAEAVVLGLVGGSLGVGLGLGLSRLMLGAVATTLNDLYFEVAISALSVSPALVAVAMLLAIGAAVCASLSAIWRAGHTPAEQIRRASLEVRSRADARLGARLGVLVIGLSVPITALSGKSLVGGFAGLFCVAVGAAMVTPALLGWAVAFLSARTPSRWFAVAQAIRLSRNSVSRTGVASAALMMAAATGIGVSTMVASFRISVDDWLTQLLRADMYVTLEGGQGLPGEAGFTAAQVDAIEASPALTFVTTIRRSQSRLIPEGVTVDVSAYRLHRPAFEGFTLLSGTADAAWAAFQSGDGALISEPFANRFGVKTGDRLRLEGSFGEAIYRVAAIYRDYGSERGTVALSLAGGARLSAAEGADGLGLYATPGATPAQLSAAVAAALPPDTAFVTTATGEVLQRSLEVFDRTFVVTGVLRNLALFIACAGMASALLALGLERLRVLATYRALGAGRGTLFKILLAESTLLGFLASVFAVPVGLVLAWGLIEVINVRSFGWRMALEVPVGEVMQVVFLATLAAMAAALLPAIDAARVKISGVLHDE